MVEGLAALSVVLVVASLVVPWDLLDSRLVAMMVVWKVAMMVAQWAG